MILMQTMREASQKVALPHEFLAEEAPRPTSISDLSQGDSAGSLHRYQHYSIAMASGSVPSSRP